MEEEEGSGMVVEEESGVVVEEGSGVVVEGGSGVVAEEGSGVVVEEGSGVEEEEEEEAEEVSGIEGLGVTQGQWFILSRQCHEISLSNKVRKEHTCHYGTSFSHYNFSRAASFCMRSQFHVLQGP